MRYSCILLALIFTCVPFVHVDAGELIGQTAAMPFGVAGKFKMLYDARQRPQSVLINGRLFIVYNGDAQPSKSREGRAYPMLITYDPDSRQFSDSTRLGASSTDHHFSPILWADEGDNLHVLYGCHKTPGVHLVSRRPLSKEMVEIEWDELPSIAPQMSYPTVFRISGNRELIYYRTGGHTSSWTYRISDDNGRTWTGPERDVTDLDSRGRVDWSSYHTTLPSRDGRTLHVAYSDYDDNKRHSRDAKRLYNPRYNRTVSNQWKYNLSYVRIDLLSHEVRNSDEAVLRTPIDIDYSKEYCQIWDTEWRGAGVPPAVCLDRNGDPAFLHVLSESDIESHRYYYVCRKNGRWAQSPICESNHQWNSGHLSRNEDGAIRAYVVVGEGYLKGGYMDRHGGGRIEEWVSRDEGNTWSKRRQVSPEQQEYAGWRFNNVQPVVRPDGSQVEGMLLFYGWRDAEEPDARAFLVHESSSVGG